ncbi:hypothetical protein CXG81DRAFT_15256 [Caulochytrium protostelioides]|uniref:DUF1692-domain-containing protein n=1 Tax=Caulochytrium protostelioides TaxID=1555241 RepID=A0A4P9WZP6_9FUNG|nr:DUF1692-domain-containing protein [Caulochytrium protostelioides]RKO98941.1 hypothetical protein CXG81DRAFT_15256 [Caulochytrium protostelioides]|eukprot:RKO98941.1 hypothetical protein CXG81DRAFT_15256 [Caulochytrium protostelioides]
MGSFKDFDAYARPLEDFRVKTLSGATVTLLSGFIILILLLSEFRDWMTVQIHPSIEVDRGRKEKLWININATFPHIPCYLLSIDVMDVAGEHQNDIDHSMLKTRLDPAGLPVDVTRGAIGEKHDSNDDEIAKAKDPNYCGPCYGGEPANPNGCCNTCEDVRNAYIAKGWSFDSPDTMEQCRREGWSQKIAEQQDEGCNIHGHIEVNKVPGNFHFAPGKSFQQNHMHVHDLHAYHAGSQFDFTHTIHQLSFGKEDVNRINPLDGVSKTAPESAHMYQYFLKVVSTNNVYRSGREVPSNIYSVTEHEKSTAAGFGAGLPGVFFNFDISPMLITYTEYKKPLSHFLTDVCAIVGGIFTVAGIINSFVYTAEKTLKRKMDLGKAN